jgi:tol-pal system protein YbgF
MRRVGWIGGLAALVVIVTGGCYGAKVLRQPIAIDETEQRVRSLAEQQAALQAEISRLAQVIEQQEELIRSLRADTQTRFSELSDNMSSLGSRVEDRLDRPPAQSGMTNYPAMPPPQSDLPPMGTPAADSAGGQAGLSPAQLKVIYDNAYLDLNRGNYALALLGFRDFLGKAPGSDLADNAQYWIGECYYAQHDFAKAIEEFSRLGQDYPQGDKVPAALLKVAYAHLQLEDQAAAKSALEDLIQRFPSSNEAAQARSKLQSIE